jgi:hypothetical protein
MKIRQPVLEVTKHIGEFLQLDCELVKENHVVEQAKTCINLRKQAVL